MNCFNVLLKQRLAYHCLLLITTVFPLFSQEPGPSNNKGTSFLQTRPVYMHQSMNNNLFLQHTYAKKGAQGLGVAVTPFFFRSLKRHSTQGYFLPNGKHQILIAGDANDQKTVLQRDVRAEYLNMSSTTNTVYSINPTYKQSGFILDLNQDIKNIVPIDIFASWQVGLRIPLLIVEHSLHPAQFPLPSTTVEDVTKVLSDPLLYVQKIKSHQMSTGLGDMQLYLGSPYFVKDHFIFAAHSGCVIPLAPKPSCQYLFSPSRGNDYRFAIYGGVDMQIPLNKDPRIWHVSFFTSVESFYMFHTHAKRTFDIKNKPWSRFLPFNRSDDPTQINIPGVNVLTLNAHMRPQTYGELSCGWRCMSEKWYVELGYDLWGHDSERIEYIDDQLAPVFGIAGSGSLLSSSNSTIAKKSADDERFVSVSLDDLDLNSAVATSALNHSFYLAIGGFKTGQRVDAFLAAGAFIERGQRAGSLPQWGVWVKVGATI